MFLSDSVRAIGTLKNEVLTEEMQTALREVRSSFSGFRLRDVGLQMPVKKGDLKNHTCLWFRV